MRFCCQERTSRPVDQPEGTSWLVQFLFICLFVVFKHIFKFHTKLYIRNVLEVFVHVELEVVMILGGFTAKSLRM